MENQLVDEDIDREELGDAKNLIKSLLLLLKTYGLYSEYHPFCEKMLGEFHAKLSSFLGKYGNTVLSIQKKSILYEGNEIHTGPANEENIAFSFFRDGVEWIEILEDIEAWETGEIIRVLHTYKRLAEEAEGDFVTAFWELELPHFRYEASEFIPDDEFQSIKTQVAQSQMGQSDSTKPLDIKSLRGKQVVEPDSGATPSAKTNSNINTINTDATELTVQETEGLDRMLVQEEELDLTREILYMLSDILHDQDDRQFFDLTLEFLKKSLEEALVKSRFDSALIILQTVLAIRESCQKEKEWAVSAIDGFLQVISGSASLETLRKELSDRETSYLEEIKEILLLMPPETISVLSSMLLEIEAKRSQEMLTEVITALAQQDCTPIEPLLKNASDDLLIILINVLEKVPGERSKQMLFNVIGHKSEIIRRVVLKTLIKKQVWDPAKLFLLIDDESASVRKTLLDYLSSRRCDITEKLLMNYLMKKKTSGGKQNHYLDCFKVLGLCGSEHALPFLRNLLLEGTIMTKLFGSITLHGAGIALSRLDQEEAHHILKKAAGSFYPGLRRSVRTLVDSD